MVTFFFLFFFKVIHLRSTHPQRLTLQPAAIKGAFMFASDLKGKTPFGVAFFIGFSILG